jgi:hypothetical protein
LVLVFVWWGVVGFWDDVMVDGGGEVGFGGEAGEVLGLSCHFGGCFLYHDGDGRRDSKYSLKDDAREDHDGCYAALKKFEIRRI